MFLNRNCAFIFASSTAALVTNTNREEMKITIPHLPIAMLVAKVNKDRCNRLEINSSSQ